MNQLKQILSDFLGNPRTGIATGTASAAGGWLVDNHEFLQSLSTIFAMLCGGLLSLVSLIIVIYKFCKENGIQKEEKEEE